MKKTIAILLVNLLTTIRIIGVFLLIPIFWNYGGIAAALLSVGCYFTDCLDGIIARKCKVSTFFGSVFDGCADKAFTCANLIVLFTITKFAIIPILFEISIILIQTFKFQKNMNVKSSTLGKLKTWVISLTVILLYLLIDIQNITFLSQSTIDFILNTDKILLYGITFIPLYVFEVLTLYSYLVFLKNYKPGMDIETPKVDIKMKPATSIKNKWDNFALLWLNNEVYEKYKDSAGLKGLRKSLKENR